MRIEDCDVKVAIDVIGGKWKPLILFALKNGTLRFGELRRKVPGSTHKVFTEQLRQLEADGIVDRSVIAGAVPGTSYCLSGYGRTLRPVLKALSEWGAGHRARISRMRSV